MNVHLTVPVLTAGEDAKTLDLHAAMMNLPCKVPTSLVSDVTREHYLLADDPVIRAYRVGHRDARHAAAELALQADAMKAELLFELEGLVHFSDGFGLYGDGPAAKELRRWVYGARAAIAKATGEQQ